MAPSLFYIYAMATSFFYIYAMATSFFYIYAMATSFFYIYVMATSFFYFYVMDISSFYIYVMATSFFYIYKSTERPVVLLNAIFEQQIESIFIQIVLIKKIMAIFLVNYFNRSCLTNKYSRSLYR